MCLAVGQKGRKVLSSDADILNGFDGGGAFFTGEFVHSLDPKKRLTIPSEWREMVGPPHKFYVLPSIESRSVALYRVPDFMRKINRLREHSIADPKARQMARILGSRSAVLGWDAAGRIRIKDELLAEAGLEHKVALVGALDRIELWNPDEWSRIGAAGESASLEDAVRYVNL